jgi:predicted aspartyl protease
MKLSATNLLARLAAIALLAALPTGQAVSQAAPASVSASVALGYDKDGRPTAPVSLNGKGPFTLVIDSGASGTGINEALAAELGLSADTNSHAAIRGAGGTSSVQLFQLDSLSIGGITLRPAQAAGLPNARISDARGVLGADTFASGRVEFDFGAGRLNASTSPGVVPAGFRAVPANLVHRTFALVPVRIGGIEVTALVDSGARGTVANFSLMRALGYAEGDARLTAEDTPTGATGHIQRTWKGGRGDLVVGGETVAGQALVFADLPIFGAFGLGDKPGLILGIDSLRRFDTVAIDYPRSELQLRPKR